MTCPMLGLKARVYRLSAELGLMLCLGCGATAAQAQTAPGTGFGNATTKGLKFEDPAVDDELLPVQLGGYWGLINQRLRLITLPRFDWTDVGVEGLARATHNGRTGFILGNGHWRIEPVFEHIDRFAEDYAVYRVDDKYGYLEKSGRASLRPELDGALRFADGRAGVRVGERCAFLDRRMQAVTGWDYVAVRSYHEGLAAVCLPWPDGGGPPKGEAEPDPDDGEEREPIGGVKVEEVPPPPQRNESPLRDGMWGYLDKANTLVFSDSSGRIDELGDFNDGLARYRVGDRWGYMDRTFRVVVSPRFDEARDFTNGLAAVKVGDQWGYLDRTYDLAVPPQFDDADDFDDTLAMVQVDGKYGFVDRLGRMIITPQFDDARPFRLGFARVSVDDGFGYVDVAGNVSFNPRDAKYGITNVTTQERARRSVSYHRPYNDIIRVPLGTREPLAEPYPPEYEYEELLFVPK